MSKSHRLLIPVTVCDFTKSYFVYVPITKCASTFISNFLQGPDFDSHEWNFVGNQGYHNPPPRDQTWHMTVLRDPLDRWISGIVHWLSHRSDWLDMIPKVFDQIEMDIHTTPQSWFLSDIDFDRTVWIQYRKNLENHSWFAQHGWHLPTVPDYSKNITRSGHIKEHLLDHLDLARRDRIRDFYQKDYDLIRTTQPI